MADTGIHLGTMVTLANTTAYASKTDWARHQTRIKDLYSEHPLPKVMQIMESEHCFKATPKMYKTHIKQWGLDKKNKQHEMIALVHKHAARVQKGKDSEFRVRGKALPFAEILRYWQRNGLSIDDVVTQRAASKTPEMVECFTPPLSPLGTPKDLGVPERICIMIRDYYKGSFEAGVWTVDDEGQFKDFWYQKSSLARTFGEECHLASHLLSRGRFEEAGKILINATADIKTIVQAQPPIFLPLLLDIAQSLRRQGKPEFSSAILWQVSGMGEILLGQEHPLKLLCGWLASANEVAQDFFNDVIARSTRAVYEVFKAFRGHLHELAFYVHSRLLNTLSETDSKSWGSALQDLLYECEPTLGGHDARTLNIRLMMAHEHLQHGRINEARRLAETVSAQTENEKYRCLGLYALAMIQYRLGNTEEAETNLRAAIEIGKSLWGGDDAVVQRWILWLEDWLEARGDPEAAAELERERLSLR